VSANPFEGMDHDAMLRALREKTQGIEARVQELRAGLESASATASSPDGAVTVTLSPTGALQNISFSAKAAGHKPEALGPLVMSAVRAAQRQVSAKLTESLQGVGDQSTMDFFRRFVPEPEPEPTERPSRRDADEGVVLRKRPGRTRPDHDEPGGGILR
jgi:DNA-binding protein YbaB